MTAGVITRGNFPRDLKPVVAYYFGKAYKDHPELYMKMFESESTSDAYEEYASYAGLSAAQLKTEGGSITYDSAQELFNQRVQILTYGLGFKVTREMIEDGKVMKFAERKAVELKKACMDNKELRGADVLNNAFNSSFVGADGKELCATDHPILDGSYANEPTVAADLSESALEDAVINLRKLVNNRGLRIHVTPTMPIIPPDLEFDLCRIMDGKERAGTANRDINALGRKGYIGGSPVINPYLTDSDAWFLKTDVDKGLIHLNRRGMAIESDNDHDTQNASYIATFRDAFLWNDARGVYGSPGAA